MGSHQPSFTIPEFGEEVPGADYILRPGGYIIARNSKGEIAVISTPQGFFLPGGGQDGLETPEEAAVRETNEECGLQVQLAGRVGTADELVFDAAEGKYYRKRCAFYDAEFVGCDEGGEADHHLVWMTADKATTQLRHQSQRWAVSKADGEEG
ncbi:MAG: NUDIX domain-containing protein [Pyrinomonadaceae bacterium]|nr:NUDIX domain-containing protein [Pyrinomonadaceae bacterium]